MNKLIENERIKEVYRGNNFSVILSKKKTEQGYINEVESIDVVDGAGVFQKGKFRSIAIARAWGESEYE